jgi:Protein of unknown function (DUF4035)
MREPDVEAMLRRLTAKQFRNWEIYHDLEPFGEIRADYRAASIVQIVHNMNRGPKTKALTLQECMLKFETEPKKQQSWQTMQSIAKMIAMAYNAPGITA